MHFILNLQRPKITTANAWATRPPLPLGFTGGGGTLIRDMSAILQANLK